MDDRIHRMARGLLKAADLPLRFSPWDLKEPLGELRCKALAEKVEWGGCVTLRNGSLLMRHTSRGTQYAVGPAEGCLGPRHSPCAYSGFAHIHLPDEEMRRALPGFSACDYRATLADGDSLSLVASADEVYALVRTADLTCPAGIVSWQDFSDWCRMYEEAFQQAETDGHLDEHLYRVNLSICAWTGYAFYRGLWGRPLEQIFAPMEEAAGISAGGLVNQTLPPQQRGAPHA